MKLKLRDVPIPPPDVPVLTRQEAARLARIGLSTLDKAIRERRLQVKRHGRKITVHRQELARFIAANDNA